MWMLIFAGWPTLVCLYVAVHRRTSLMSLSLFEQQCSAWFVWLEPIRIWCLYIYIYILFFYFLVAEVVCLGSWFIPFKFQTLKVMILSVFASNVNLVWALLLIFRILGSELLPRSLARRSMLFESLVWFGVMVIFRWLFFSYIFTNPSARAGYDTRSIFKRSLTGLNSEFSFS